MRIAGVICRIRQGRRGERDRGRSDRHRIRFSPGRVCRRIRYGDLNPGNSSTGRWRTRNRSRGTETKASRQSAAGNRECVTPRSTAHLQGLRRESDADGAAGERGGDKGDGFAGSAEIDGLGGIRRRRIQIVVS